MPANLPRHYSPFGTFKELLYAYSDAGETIKYKFGLNSQEEDDEIVGEGNIYKSEVWEYDARLGRRWNLDPIFRAWESGNATLRINPLFNIDRTGLEGEPSTNIKAQTHNLRKDDPYGSALPGLQYNYADNGDTSKYRFGFNNQEQDSELGDYYAFEYRIHDARLGRFLSVDPLARKFSFWSPYQFAGNQCISSIELEGLEVENNLNMFENEDGVGMMDDGNTKDKTLSNSGFHFPGGLYIENSIQAISDITSLVGINSNLLVFNNLNDIMLQVTIDWSLAPEKHKKSDKKFERYKKRVLRQNDGLDIINRMSISNKSYFYGVLSQPSIRIRNGSNIVNVNWPAQISGTYFRVSMAAYNYKPNFMLNTSETYYSLTNPYLLPQYGFHGQVNIAPGQVFVENTYTHRPYGSIETTFLYGSVTDRWRLILHELRENYFRTEYGETYEHAHESAGGLMEVYDFYYDY
jgi:RHS repeat-associated protein